MVFDLKSWRRSSLTCGKKKKKAFCQAVLLALDVIETRHAPGVVVTTSAIEKFYSNGLNLEHASLTPGYFPDSLYALWRRLLTYPMPTVALVNGHAFAGALMTAMMHDYRIMNPSRGYLCLNEVELGVPLRPPMSSIFRQKTSPTTYRKLVLEAARFKVFLSPLSLSFSFPLLSPADRALSHRHRMR